MTNLVVLRGRLSRPAEQRQLPSGDRMAVLDLTVPADGSPKEDGRGPRAESVPLAWFGAPAWVMELGVDADLLVLGRVRRRFFRTGAGPVQSRTEVVVEAAAPGRRSAKVADVMRRIEAHIDGLAEEPPPGRARKRAAATF